MLGSNLKPATRCTIILLYCSCTTESHQLTFHYKTCNEVQLNCHLPLTDRGFEMSQQAVDLLWSLCSQTSLSNDNLNLQPLSSASITTLAPPQIIMHSFPHKSYQRTRIPTCSVPRRVCTPMTLMPLLIGQKLVVMYNGEWL